MVPPHHREVVGHLVGVGLETPVVAVPAEMANPPFSRDHFARLVAVDVRAQILRANHAGLLRSMAVRLNAKRSELTVLLPSTMVLPAASDWARLSRPACRPSACCPASG